MNGWTPGHWTAEHVDRHLSRVRAASVPYGPLAEVWAPFPWNPDVPSDEHVANANLMAAAPDLHDACRALVNAVLAHNVAALRDALASAEAAIAIAEGSQS